MRTAGRDFEKNPLVSPSVRSMRILKWNGIRRFENSETFRGCDLKYDQTGRDWCPQIFEWSVGKWLTS